MAELLGVSQAEVSKMERRTELYVGTLRKFIEAMNGGSRSSGASPLESEGGAHAGVSELRMSRHECAGRCDLEVPGRNSREPWRSAEGDVRREGPDDPDGGGRGGAKGVRRSSDSSGKKGLFDGTESRRFVFCTRRKATSLLRRPSGR
jgi:hypothetical protein